jgi:glucose-1-phosphate thymidylyltransferase
MRGIVLAGGKGTRLYPATKAVSKQLLPVFDKPMIFYPIATLMAAGIREILIITTPDDQHLFFKLLGDGSQIGVSFKYEVQAQPNGLAEAIKLGSNFANGSSIALILGDNVFHGTGLGRELAKYKDVVGAQIFAYEVANPEDYGVIEFNKIGEINSIIEKPKEPKSRFAIPGLYFYDSSVFEVVQTIKPSARGELEITSLNEKFLLAGLLKASILPRGTSWFDTGTFENLHDASNYVRILEARQNLRVACLEEIAWRLGWISTNELQSLANSQINLGLQNYLLGIIRSG